MLIRDLVCAVVTVGLVASGCGKAKDDKASGQGGAGGAAAGSTAAGSAAAGSAAAGSGTGSAAEAPLPPVIEVDKAAVQQAIDAWLAAQNGGDFAAYQAMYAIKMEGVKRVGARTWRFDRKGWLADRERMFKNKMTVAARDLSIGGSNLAPVVELVQSFKQGKFADEGTKRLVLVRTNDGLRIAREEMLQSVVAGAMAAKAGGQLWLPLKLEGKPYAVLAEEADDAWGTGRPQGPFSADFSYALRDASKAPSAASWATRDLVVIDAAGKRCPAKVGGLQLIGGGTPHFGEVQTWDGIDGQPVWSKPARARAIYDMSAPRLIGALTIEGGCDPVVVVDAASTAKSFAQQPADAAADAKAIAAFRKLPGYATIQDDFKRNYEGKGPWVESPAVETFTDGARTIVVVSAREGSGCGDFFGALTAVYEATGGKLTLISAPDQGYLDVSAVLDVDGDGVLALIARPDDFSTVTALYQGGTDGFASARAIEFPFNDCGC